MIFWWRILTEQGIYFLKFFGRTLELSGRMLNGSVKIDGLIDYKDPDFKFCVGDVVSSLFAGASVKELFLGRSIDCAYLVTLPVVGVEEILGPHNVGVL